MVRTSKKSEILSEARGDKGEKRGRKSRTNHEGVLNVYIVECKDGSLYTGITNNLEKRLRQHNGEITGGAFYTKNKRPVKLVYTEEYKTHLEAARREVEIKKYTREKKQKLFLGH